jgi:hypothetical protein
MTKSEIKLKDYLKTLLSTSAINHAKYHKNNNLPPDNSIQPRTLDLFKAWSKKFRRVDTDKFWDENIENLKKHYSEVYNKNYYP